MIKCAFDKTFFCSVLTEKSCSLCPFYKTERELNEGRRQANERIDHLPRNIRAHLVAKYGRRETSDEI